MQKRNVMVGMAVVAASIGGPALPVSAADGLTPTTTCADEGGQHFICGQRAPEDLIPIAGTRWVLVSSYEGGGLRLVDKNSGATTVVYAADNARDQFDKAAYPTCPGPLAGEERSAFRSHGLALRPIGKGRYRVHVVHHGERESIEVFTLDLMRKPQATWIGCAVAPWPVGLNSVVGLPDGGFIASNFRERGPGDPASRAKMAAAQVNGELWEWHKSSDWHKIPGSEASGANGVELSRDGKWIYMAEWGAKAITRLARNGDPALRQLTKLDFKLDNIRLAPDGFLYGGGQGATSSTIIRVDPATMAVTRLAEIPNSPNFSGGTLGMPVDHAIWVASYRGDRLLVLPKGP